MERLVFIACVGLLVAGCGSDNAPDTAAPSAAAAPAEQQPAARGGDEPARPASTSADSDVASAEASILAQEFAYGGTEERNFIGYFATPTEIIEPLPGVVLVHEWWGLNDSVRELARRLAMAGYAVLAVDLYDREVATDSATAEALMAEVTSDREAAIGNIGQAIDYLRAYALAPRVALVGFGMGGGMVLDATFSISEKVDAVVTYYGRPIFDEAVLSRLRAPLLGFYGELDDSISVRNVQSFRNSLQTLGKDANVFIQIGAAHGFADPARPAFNAEVAEESWEETLAFLERTIAARR